MQSKEAQHAVEGHYGAEAWRSSVLTRRWKVRRPDWMPLDIGPLPVEEDRLVATITHRDIAVQITAVGQVPKNTRVREAMTKNVVYCHEVDDVRAATRLMESKQVRRLAVLNDQNKIVGIAALADVAVWTRDRRLGCQVLEHVSEPSEPNR